MTSPNFSRQDPPHWLTATDEEVVLYLPGFAVLRAAYEAEGYYDAAADGEPEEQDLYRVEVLDATRAALAEATIEGEREPPLANLGLTEPTVCRLVPATRWTPDGDPLGLLKRYLLVLGHTLRDEARPASRQRLLESSVGWSPEVIDDAFHALPPAWRATTSP